MDQDCLMKYLQHCIHYKKSIWLWISICLWCGEAPLLGGTMRSAGRYLHCSAPPAQCSQSVLLGEKVSQSPPVHSSHYI